VLEPEGPAFEAVARRWPGTVVDGVIDRSRLAAIVFNDPGQLAELEAMTHPHIRRIILAMVEGAEGPVAVEVPLLSDFLGAGWTRVVVDAPDEVRLQRLLARGVDPGDARARMRAQPSREQWLAGADVVVDNSGDEDHLMAEAERLAETLGI
jgi:dephospho-CoA kinase